MKAKVSHINPHTELDKLRIMLLSSIKEDLFSSYKATKEKKFSSAPSKEQLRSSCAISNS